MIIIILDTLLPFIIGGYMEYTSYIIKSPHREETEVFLRMLFVMMVGFIYGLIS